MKLAKTLAIIACASLLSAGVTASAGHAYTQDAGSTDDGGVHSAANVATQPDNSPIVNFEGCWDGSSTVGSLDDLNFGTGYGWIGIIQNGNTVKGGKHGSYYEFVWDSGQDWAYGPLKGKVGKNEFTASGTVGGKCKVKIIGHLGTSNDIVGTYDYTNCNPKKINFIDTSGMFDVPLNNNGCANIIPPH
jgi:hypothetical protein